MTQPAPETPLLNPGDLVAGYRIKGLLGKGAMGAVYEARQESLERKVALKVLFRPRDAGEKEAQTRLLREGKLLARLNHPNIVQVHDGGADRGSAFLVMELVEGTNLSEV